jgi:hypothetical protein
VTEANGFSGNVTLAASGLPSGITASFTPNPTTGASEVTFTADSAAPLGGPVTVTITGTSGSLTDSTTVQLSVVVPPSFTLSTQTGILSVAQGESSTIPIDITALASFSGSVSFAVSGLPNGVTGSFSPNPATGASTTLTVTASGTAVIQGPINITVTGTSGSDVEETTIALTVTGAPTFAASGNPDASITIEPGATSGNTATIAVIGVNGFTGTVNLACAITPTVNNPPTCALSPTSVTITGTAAVASLLTITTAAPGSAMVQPQNLIWPPAGGTALAVVVLLFMPRRRKNWLALAVLLALVVSLGAMGCGGKGSGGGPGTSAGSYTVTVTGTSGSINATVGTVSLTIQ